MKLVKKLPNEKVLDVKWIYSKKSDDTYKTRLVVREFQQTNVIDVIYATIKFKRSNVDYCLHIQGEGTDKIYLLIYVDDLLICSKSKKKTAPHFARRANPPCLCKNFIFT